jgi:hypothetical protein
VLSPSRQNGDNPAIVQVGDWNDANSYVVRRGPPSSLKSNSVWERRWDSSVGPGAAGPGVAVTGAVFADAAGDLLAGVVSICTGVHGSVSHVPIPRMRTTATRLPIANTPRGGGHNGHACEPRCRRRSSAAARRFASAGASHAHPISRPCPRRCQPLVWHDDAG